MTPVRGRAWLFGRNVNTDLIFPAWMSSKVKGFDDLSAAAMAGIDPEFHKKVTCGDCIVAQENFGCGSSRESAPLALLHAGIAAVVAKSFGRIFYRNCVNVGLWPLACLDISEIRDGDQVELDIGQGSLRRRSSGHAIGIDPPDGICMEILLQGGLMPYIRARDWRL